MKKYIIFYTVTLVLTFTTSIFGQVGIGTTTPKGILEVNSSTQGIVYPSVELTSTQLSAPVVNPQGGALENGTTVYNTRRTTSGSNDVEPGIYSWDAVNSEWVTHFFHRQIELFEQTTSLRTSGNAGFQSVPGLEGLSFTANYSGLYRIEVKVNYGGGQLKNNGAVNAAMAQGTFRFRWDGNNNNFDVKAISARHADFSPVDSENIWTETYRVIYVNLTAQQTYNFYLRFDQDADSNFRGNTNNSSAGRGYIGEDIPCYIEIAYIDEN